MIISSDSERKATRYPFRWRGGIRVLQGTAREHRFLGVIEGDGTEFLPVAHELVFYDNLMDSQLTLYHTSVRTILSRH
jgi:hypothetical protein